ncbi:MAG: hypothetical protein A2998_00810 [Candidatus Staskawiczbacteria bacterium RIFCSPLOWO2_01_FULL_37_25b]|uniref:HNH endonuclease n=2 Tax=Candidatus Staskawicziibacteriota TaxID=1817916 RepID=A0A1G2IB62_9BACT|nr:MAG: hypothetical protein A2998_00810 [Candidatus Staskawiczbacteria bacterium RIFCSPLOWO2_01_FULL_37_25b]
MEKIILPEEKTIERGKLSKTEIKRQYDLISEYHKKYLKKLGVKMPKLRNGNGKFTMNALVLVYLSLGYPKTRVVSKTELTTFIRNFYPKVNDVQQARHLGAQDGWWIVAGGRDNIVLKVDRGSYQLFTLEQSYPDFKKGHRITDTGDWEKLKEQYGFRCATCGSRDGEPHFNWSGTKTKLERAHKNPNKPLIAGNIIPQCTKCNKADRDRWVYDEKGRVIKLADASFVRNFDKEVREKIYRILYVEFKGVNPNKLKK